jgi:hypothetical protein
MTRSRPLLIVTLVATLLLVGQPFALAFSEPTGSPPGGNVAAPLNVSSTSQTKTGDLTIQGDLTIAPALTPIGSLTIGDAGGSSRLCLNGTGASDCITSWSQIIGGSQFVNLFSGPTSDVTSVQTGGFARVQAGANQDFALQGISSAQAGAPRYGIAGIVSTAGVGDPLSYGVYGRGGGSSLAALFSGNVSVVNGKLQVGKIGAPAEICLYGSGVEECINKWTLAALNAQSASSDFVLVQRPTPASPAVVAQYGQVNVSGNANFGTVTLGEPTAATPITASCGDGICSAVNGENTLSCSQDCLSFISGPTISAVGNDSATVTWRTNAATTGRVEYGFTESFSDAQYTPKDDATLTTNHAVTLTGLNFNKTYYYRVTALSPSGATLSSCAPSLNPPQHCASFTTQNDTSAPSVPAKPVLNGSVAWNFAPMRWTPSTDAESGISGYEIFRRVTGPGPLVAITTVIEPFFNDSQATGLVKNTSYDYAVKAINGGGLKSALSPTLTIVVPNDADITPPSCPTGLQHTNPIVGEIYNAYYGSGLTRNFSWNKPGDSDLAGYHLFRKLSNNTGWQQVNSGLIDKNTLTFVDSAIISRESNYDYLIVSVDTSGNGCGFAVAGPNFRTLTTAPDICDITNPAKQWGCPTVANKRIFFSSAYSGTPITLTQQALSWNVAQDDPGGAGISGYEIWRVHFPGAADKDRFLTSCSQACLGEAAWNSTTCTGVSNLSQPVQERIQNNSSAGGPLQYLDTTLPASGAEDKRGWTFSYCVRPIDNATPANIGKLPAGLYDPGPKRLPPATCETDSQCSVNPNNSSEFPVCCSGICSLNCGGGPGGGGKEDPELGLLPSLRPETPTRLAVAPSENGVTVISPLSLETASKSTSWFRAPLRLLQGLRLADLIPVASAAAPVDVNPTLKKTTAYEGVVQATAGTQSLELGNAGRDIAASGKIAILPHSSVSDARTAFFTGAPSAIGSGLSIDAKTAASDTVSVKARGTGAGANAVTATQTNGGGLAGQFVGRVHVTGNLSASTKNAVVETSRGAAYLYTLEAPEAKFLDEGTAELSEGQAIVRLDPTFTSTISSTVPYLVFLTAGNGVSQLSVGEKHADAFVVRGQGSGTFSYRIVGTRAGFEGVRFDQTR